MFLFKKIVSPLFLPLSLCVEILMAGLILLWFTRRQKAGKTVVSIGMAMLIVLSNSTISNLALRALETKYPPLILASDAGNHRMMQGVKFIVVLAAGFSSDPGIPITSQVAEDTMVRLVEGILLHKELPGSKLVLSAGRGPNSVPGAAIMAQIARALGVKPQDILLEAKSRDTEEEAQLVEPMVGKNPLILVTSASHMPRAMALFRNLGMNPLAAPTDYLARQSSQISPEDVYPSTRALRKTEAAVYECLGLAWGKLRGKI